MTSSSSRSRCSASRPTPIVKEELDQARTSCSTSRRTCSPSTRTSTARSWPTARRSLALGWTGVLTQDMADTPDKGYVVPSEGSIFWLDTWVLLADAPHPNAAYAFLDFIHDPEIQAEETNYNNYGTPNARPSRSSTRRSWPTRPSSRRMTSSRSSRGRRTPRPTPSAPTSGKSSSRSSAADDPVEPDHDDGVIDQRDATAPGRRTRALRAPDHAPSPAGGRLVPRPAGRSRWSSSSCSRSGRGPATAGTRRPSSSTTTFAPSRSPSRSSPASRWPRSGRSCACSSGSRWRTSSRPEPGAGGAS